MVKVIIVEDDPMVAKINQGYLQEIPGLRVLGQFGNGREALAFLKETGVDLMILDVYMPELNGLELLRKVRKSGLSTEVIMVTAANDARQVDEMLRLGIIDYLVKPFTGARFREAVEKYLYKRRTLDAVEELDQGNIDRLLGGQRESGAALQKGLQQPTLELVAKILRDESSHYHNCDELASRTSLSKVTVRRYLNHLVDSGQAESAIDYDTGGRPSVKYCYREGR